LFNLSNIINRYESVFPVPDLDYAIKSLPSIPKGIVLNYIGVGELNYNFSNAVTRF